MSLSNISSIVDQLGLPFSCVAARRDLVSFSINQLNLLKNVSRKFSQIDLLDKNYPSDEILGKFFRNGSRVLEESLSLMNNNSHNVDLPRPSILARTTGSSLGNYEFLTHRTNDISNWDLNQAMVKLEQILNESLISFFCTIGNSGLFLHNMNFLKNVLSHISIKRLRYPGLVCVLGIISKCDLFRYDEFQAFIGSIFSYFTRNHKALGYLSDLDTTLLLFHKIATLYMVQPSSPSTNPRNLDSQQMKHSEELLTLLEVSIDKVSEMVNYRPSDSTASGGCKHMKSLNNLIQSVFLIHEYDTDLIYKLPVDKLIKIKSILSEDSINKLNGYTYNPDEDDPYTSKINSHTTNRPNTTSFLHLKIQSVLNAILSSDTSGTDTNDVGSNCVDHKDAGERKGVKKVLNEIRVGSSLYFIDMLVI
ncbi:hypothetical protein MACK_000911 [Theileria orientalis]|uniref:Uncharacterized protein n=1 Tax=Theileria orientalis TaxID=68886 RepID=A0A976QWS3_THEOR|nr:hypothetical protein MACK_000911 [Theileria orientalis]